MIVFEIAYSSYHTGYALSDDSCNSRTGDTHPRRSEQSEDQNRIQNDIRQRPAQLGNHAEDRLSGRGEQSFKEELGEKPEGKDHDRAQVVNSHPHNLPVGSSDLAEIERLYDGKSQNQEHNIAEQIQYRGIRCRLVCLVRIFLSEGLGQQGIHTHARTTSHCNQQGLQRECQ